MNTTLELSELHAKIGQLFMAGIPGPQLDEGTEALIRDYHLGGVILFSRNVEDPIQLATLCRDLQRCSLMYQESPLFLAVDQEGGRVARLREPFTKFPGNTAIGSDDDPVAKATAFGRITATEMRLVGLNMNLAPVVDVRRGKTEKHLEGRTFGEDPALVALLGRTVIRSLQDHGVMAVAKHFPGLGRTALDPHLTLPKIEIELSELEDVNLPPFAAAVGEGVSGIMSSHAVYPALDGELPATLSRIVLTDLLRKRLNFEGLILTDDLEMGAIEKHWGVAQGAVAAFDAGADILLICKDQNFVVEAFEAIRRHLLQEEISYERLHQSYERIMKSKSIFTDQEITISFDNVCAYFKIT
jgi:beta-N-acetylhexosaminidase